MKDEMRYESKHPVVIVTGASSGLGAAFVRLLDESLPSEVTFWLIARNEEKLCQFADGLQHEAQCFALDLTDVGSFSVISDALRSSDGTVQLLINNAGEGASGSFEKQTSRYQESLCDLNVRAQVSLTSIVLPYMEEGSAIIFTSSVAAFLPQPGLRRMRHQKRSYSHSAAPCGRVAPSSNRRDGDVSKSDVDRLLYA